MMNQLSDQGHQLVQDLSNRHGFSTDAVTHMLIAVRNGNGSMAQFNHQEFGGSGQWMAGGMLMLGDMLNSQLKWRVQSLCEELANAVANHQSGNFGGSFQSQSQNGNYNQNQRAGSHGGQNSLFVPDPESNWWPQHLGSPTASGSQNNCSYAYFGNINRLAVKTGSSVWVYDTQNHHIGGFSQQQAGDGSISFSSQFGYVNLSSLPVVMKDGVSVGQQNTNPSNASSSGSSNPAPTSTSQEPRNANPAPGESVLDTLERLGSMRDKGYITDDDFNQKKQDLLSRI